MTPIVGTGFGRRLQRSREEKLLIRLELENAETCVVDLGEGTSLGEIDIGLGSESSLHGEKTKVNGKSRIVARTIRIDGDTTRVRGTSTRPGKQPSGRQ